jgi:hypothetical protein
VQPLGGLTVPEETEAIPGLEALPQSGEAPGLGALRTHLQSGEYLRGVDSGRWKILKVHWPVVIVTVTVGDGGLLGLHLDLTGYPAAAPAGIPWDVEKDAVLPTAQLPEGQWATETFRSAWCAQNGNALYLTCDRQAITTHHQNWPQENPGEAWHPNRTVVHYLQVVHKILATAKLPGAAE